MVSKQWCSLISGPYFSRCLNEIENSSALFLRAVTCSPSSPPKYHFLPLDGKPVRDDSLRSLTFVDDPAGIKILQSCNGLFLCCSNNCTVAERNYYIYNPATNEYTKLPKPGFRTPNTIFGVFLAFDPSKSSSSHYKVVFVRSSESSPRDLYQLEIFSSETQLWTFSREIPSANYSQGVYCCGAIYWRTNSGAFQCFIVDQERFEEIPMPEIPYTWGQQAKCRYFGESGDHLHLILTDGRRKTRKFNVYQMEEDFSGWFVKYEVDLSQLISAYPEMTRSNSNQSNWDWDYHAFRVLAIFSKGIESFMVLHIPGKAICYSFRDKTCTLLHDFAPNCPDIDGVTIFEPNDAYPYLRTFACV
ncbi:hypothetical protein COLO4_37368 [Corchorus olitorius]|uniref:F-box associated beta-propeller type 1 domain-containing protein n=1 Tax=Corchorus olitorius TaxID=93759 RepID=A0A1R3G272_9ROSI|nr:hypothetical protein COLO4_37368 [Corchorus olitorius]